MAVKPATLVGMKTTHDAAQSVGPITRAEGTTRAGLTLNDEISGRSGGV